MNEFVGIMAKIDFSLLPYLCFGPLACLIPIGIFAAIAGMVNTTTTNRILNEEMAHSPESFYHNPRWSYLEE